MGQYWIVLGAVKLALRACGSVFEIDLSTAISIEISCRLLSIGIDINWFSLRSNQNMHRNLVTFTPKTGISTA